MTLFGSRITLVAALVGAIALLAVPAAMGANAAAPEAPFPTGTTVVSLTFDDGLKDQVTDAVPVLANHNAKASFFINSGRIDKPGYMSSADVSGLISAGHEIGGHTITHADLPTLNAADQKAQICDDRYALLQKGYQIRNLAYPFGNANAVSEQTAQACGYNSARGVGGLTAPGSCNGCPHAESFHPADLYYTGTASSVRATTTLADLQGYVTRAEATGGGWVQFVIHHVCNPVCDPVYAVDPALLNQFLTWLTLRAATNNTIIRTVNDVIGGAVQPGVSTQPQLPPDPTLVRNHSLEGGNTTTPTCFSNDGYGTNTATFARTADAHTGNYGEQVTISAYTSGDRKIVQTQDAGACAPAVTAGRQYQLSAWYKGSWPATSSVWLTVFYRNAAGSWVYWKTAPKTAAATAWTETSYTTPAIPAGATHLSFGLALTGTGTVNTDDYAAVDVTPGS